MIDLFALAVSHLVLALAVWRLVQRHDLDDDPALPRSRPGNRDADPGAQP